MSVLWAKLRDEPRLSWHVLRDAPYSVTRCGRWIPVPSPSADDLPVLAKTCESCMKWTLRDQERANA